MQKLIGFVQEVCQRPRLHWGKAGWPRYQKCFDGAQVYPQTWCDFGCAVQVWRISSHISALKHSNAQPL